MPTLPSGLSLYALLLEAHNEHSSRMNSTDVQDPLSSLQSSSDLSVSRDSASPHPWALTGEGSGSGGGAGTVTLTGTGTETETRTGTEAGTGAGTGVGTETVTGTGTGDSLGAGSGAWGSNALVAILQRIPLGDLEALQMGVEMASSSFRYYQYNSSLRLNNEDIPTR